VSLGISAVLSFEQVGPWSFAAQRGRLIRNPWAAAPVGTFELGVDDYQPGEEAYRIERGRTLGAVIGLLRGWPGFGE
jgi:hypothetical protein